jgi:hypothetical protein
VIVGLGPRYPAEDGIYQPATEPLLAARLMASPGAFPCSLAEGGTRLSACGTHRRLLRSHSPPTPVRLAQLHGPGNGQGHGGGLSPSLEQQVPHGAPSSQTAPGSAGLSPASAAHAAVSRCRLFEQLPLTPPAMDRVRGQIALC